MTPPPKKDDHLKYVRYGTKWDDYLDEEVDGYLERFNSFRSKINEEQNKKKEGNKKDGKNKPDKQ